MVFQKTPQVSGGGTARPLLSADNYVARLVSVIHVGSAFDTMYPTKIGTHPLRNRFKFVFELPEELIKGQDGTERPIRKEVYVNYSFTPEGIENISKLNKIYMALGEDPYNNPVEIDTLVGKVCLLDIKVVKNSRGQDAEKIAAFSKLPKQIDPENPIYAQLSDSWVLFIDKDDWSLETFKGLPQWQQEDIAGSMEFRELPAEMINDALADVDPKVITSFEEGLSKYEESYEHNQAIYKALKEAEEGGKEKEIHLKNEAGSAIDKALEEVNKK